MLVSNLASGAVWLLVLVGLGAWPLALIGAGYVVVGSLFLAAVYARDTLSRKQEALAWVAPWLAAATLWALLLSAVDAGQSAPQHLLSLGLGAVIATPCYLGWQAVAFALRQQFLSRRTT